MHRSSTRLVAHPKIYLQSHYKFHRDQRSNWYWKSVLWNLYTERIFILVVIFNRRVLGAHEDVSYHTRTHSSRHQIKTIFSILRCTGIEQAHWQIPSLPSKAIINFIVSSKFQHTIFCINTIHHTSTTSTLLQVPWWAVHTFSYPNTRVHNCPHFTTMKYRTSVWILHC